MDTQMEKQNLTEPIMLANQAVAEMKKNGYVTTTCPKCNMTPKVILEDNRTVVKCNAVILLILRFICNATLVRKMKKKVVILCKR